MAIYYVNSDSQDDLGTGTTNGVTGANRAKKTLAAGLALLAVGDTLQLRGEFLGQYILTPNRANITIQAEPGYLAIVDTAREAFLSLEINASSPSGQQIGGFPYNALTFKRPGVGKNCAKLRGTTKIIGCNFEDPASGAENIYVNSGNYLFNGNRVAGLIGDYSALGFYNSAYGDFVNNIIDVTNVDATGGSVVGHFSTSNNITNLNNNIIYGGNNQTSLIIVSNNAKTINIKNNIIGPMGLTQAYNGKLVNKTGTLATVTVDYCTLIPNFKNTSGEFASLDITKILGTGVIDGGHNVIDSPKFTEPPYDGYILLGIDDGAYVYTKQIADVCEQHDTRLTWFVNRKNHIANADVPAADAAIVELAGRGHDIGCHGRSHSSMADLRAMTMQYTGGAGAANLTISGTSFSVVVPGNTAHNFSFDLSTGTLGDLAIAMNATGNFNVFYQAAANGSGYYTFYIGPGTYNLQYAYAKASSLADVSIDISTERILNFERTRYYRDEIAETIDWLNSFDGVSIESGSTGYNAGDADYLAYARTKYLNHRACGGFYTPRAQAIDLFKVETIAITTPFGSSGTYDEAGYRKRARLLAESVLMNNSVISVFQHDHTEISVEEYAAVLDEFSKFSRLWVGSHKQFHALVSVESNGWSLNVDGVTYNKTPIFSPDFKLLPTSPCIGAGTDVGLITDADGNAVPGAVGYDIGPYSYMPGWTLFDESMPALTLSPTAPGDLKQVQEWTRSDVTKEEMP